MKASFLKTSSRVSPLAEATAAGGSRAHKRHRPELAIALPLTSLIDAFSIIVIYLLIGTQSGGIELDVSKSMQLPVANAGQTIEKESSIIKVENHQYFLNNRPVTARTMGAELFNLKKALAPGEEMEILVQADRELPYDELSPILKSTSEAGIQKIKFAVVAEK